jgi:hypothetical protein
MIGEKKFFNTIRQKRPLHRHAFSELSSGDDWPRAFF